MSKFNILNKINDLERESKKAMEQNISYSEKIKTEMKFFNENYDPKKVTVYLDLINENNKLYSKNVNEIKSLRFRLNNILINSKKDDSKL